MLLVDDEMMDSSGQGSSVGSVGFADFLRQEKYMDKVRDRQKIEHRPCGCCCKFRLATDIQIRQNQPHSAMRYIIFGPHL